MKILTMDLFIYDLAVDMVDRFINQDTDRFGRITRKESEFHNTVDLVINVKTVAVDSEHLIIEFPNGNVCAINVPSDHYHKMEIM